MVDKSKQASEEKTAAASYIISFYQTVQSLNHNYANYLNYMVLLENTFKTPDFSKLEPNQRQELLEIIQAMRYHSTQAYIGYFTIMSGLNKTGSAEVEGTYQKLLKQLVLNREDIRSYVMAMNKSLMKDIIKRLLENAQDVLNELVNKPQEDNTENAG